VLPDAVEAFLDLDRRILGTLHALVLRPAFLTEEYVAGRRRSWVSPFRLYILSSLVYFVVQGWAGSDNIVFIQTDSGELSEWLGTWLPRMMFLVVPLFAALVMLVYRKPRRTYIEHLVFAVHVQSAWYLFLTVDAAGRLLGGGNGGGDGVPTSGVAVFSGGLLSVLAGLAVWAYLWLAARRFFDYGRWGTTWRWSALGVGYGLLLAGTVWFAVRGLGVTA